MTGRADRRLPRIGFLGVGWIGRARMEAVVESGAATVAGICDPSPETLRTARDLVPEAEPAEDLEALLALDLDGVVIATPSALHAAQARRALEAGVAVFCQKPLGRTAAEAEGVVEAARRADRLLALDLCYRDTAVARAIREEVGSGALGPVYAADLVFHNAYGPDKEWYYDPVRSGGGCLADLGVHLVDLALWMLDFPPVTGIGGRIYAGGELLGDDPDRVEDHAIAQLELDGGATVRIACSWNLSAGTDAVISGTFHGSKATAAFRNEEGSFYDFRAERYDGRSRTVLAEPPDAWGGRAIVGWAQRLARDPGYDPDAERLVELSRVIDAVYGRRSRPADAATRADAA